MKYVFLSSASNVKTVAASLRRQGLRAKASRKFSPVSYRAHGLPVSENLLEQDFYASGPNQKWAGDITYLRTDEGWLYLAVVIDLWSRAVIGWSMSPRMTAQLACDALQMALWRRKRPRNVIVHTDRGGQYCSADYQAQLKRHNLRGSMSAKGCCYDNACVESFFHSLKVECIHGEHFISREIMRATVFNYIECDYNRWRRHSWCGGLSPEQFENQNLAYACVHITWVGSITGVWKYRGKSKQQLTIAIIISIIFFVLIYHLIL